MNKLLGLLLSVGVTITLFLGSVGCTTKTEPKKAEAKKDANPADAKKTDQKKADEKKADEKKADEKKADEKKADEKKADEKKTDDKAPEKTGDTKAKAGEIKGAITVDGSSTVYLITLAVSKQFKQLHDGVNISVGVSGTGGGLRKFIANELDICDASRKIKPGEADDCKKNNIEFLELQVGWDGLAVVVNKENEYAKKLTIEQLKKIWHPDSDSFKNAKTWKDVDSKFPDQPLSLWGAGKDSGTFDYFTEVVNGKERLIRQDYNGSEDDNVIVTGVSKNKNAMGFFGVAYYLGNKSTLNVVSIAKKAGEEYYEPTEENVLSGKYPISRPLFIYVKKSSLKRPEVREFVDFYQRRADLVKTAGYVEMNTLQAARERKKFQAAVGASK